MLTRPLGYWTSALVNCANVSGKWADPENGGTWTLNQTGDDITGSLMMFKPNCGSVTWQVAGRMKGGVATLNATQPSPSVDKCGAPAAASITAPERRTAARSQRNLENKISVRFGKVVYFR